MHSIDVVVKPRWVDVRRSMGRLAYVAEARTPLDAWRRLDATYRLAMERRDLVSALYVAAQLSRELDMLSESEAVSIFRELFVLYAGTYCKNVCSGVDADRQLDAVEARFHRARGEWRLAELVVAAPEKADAWAGVGEASLLGCKLESSEDVLAQDDSMLLAAICERIASAPAGGKN